LNNYDVIVVGGGMVGNALACSLGTGLGADLGSNSNQPPLKIAVVENHKTNYQWPKDSFDLRVSAITRASQCWLEELGVWQTIIDERATPYSEMFVWDAGGDGSIHFDCAELGEPNLGHIIENRAINKCLVQRAAEFDAVDFYCPASPSKLTLNSQQAQLELDGGERLEAELIVGADGGDSWVRQQAGIDISVDDYEQTAVVANVKTELPHQHTAWQRFLPTGPLAFLPMADSQGSNKHSAIVWSTTPNEAQRLCELTNAEFNTELEVAFDHKLGAIVDSGPRASFPIKGRHAQQYVKPQLALIGDAAHTIHPLAGQGVNLGFADAQALAQTILNAQHSNKPIGSFKTLRRFERSRRGDNSLMLEAMGMFKRLFSNSTPGLRELRNFGLNFADQTPAIKNLFMTYAMGLSENRPKHPLD
jgi:2-octaprenylphenol hydroxylase